MIIYDLDVRRTGRPIGPFEADPPLIVDADAMLPLPIALQRLHAIPGKCSEVAQRCRCIEPIEANFSLSRKPGEFLHRVTAGEPLRPSIAIADDHREYRARYAVRKA